MVSSTTAAPPTRADSEGLEQWGHDGAAVELVDVAKRFSKRHKVVDAIGAVNLTAKRGEFVSLIGPSGCGKSTVLNLIAGLMKPSRGTIRYRGEPISGVNTLAGYMTQHDSLIPWRTVRRNIAVPLEIRRQKKAVLRDQVDEWIGLVGLEGFGDFYPNELSGGMRQRVAIARTLVYKPELLLLDEPFGALDALTRLRLQEVFLKIWREHRPTVFFVTHDLSEALSLSDRIVVFGPSPGRIIGRLEVSFPRPRRVVEVAEHPDWPELHRKLWNLLSGEVP